MELVTMIKTWLKPSKQPLTKEEAFSMFAVGKKKSIEEIINTEIKNILWHIERIASDQTKTLFDFKPWMTQEHKNKIVTEVAKHYTVLYSDDECMLISWRIK